MRKKHILSVVMAGLFALISSFSFANEVHVKEAEHGGGAVDTKEEINSLIDHHLQDSHYFVLFSNGKTGEHFGFPLPVILIDNGVHIFSSARFDHGRQLVEVAGQHYKLHHGKIYKTDASGTLHHGENGFVSNDKPINLSITKNVFIIFLVSILLFIIFRGMAKSYKRREIPKGLSRFLEPIVIFIRDDVAKTSIGPKYRKYVGWLLTIFFFILFMNLLGMTPFGVNVTGNITVTFTLAVITFIITQFSGNKHYWKHIFWFPDVPVIMKIVLIPIEILGMFTKPFALMIRLFANMTAGHIIIMSLLGLIVVFQNWFAGVAFVGFSLFISLIEILVAFLQAYIFTLLSALYIGMAIEEHKEPVKEGDDDYPMI